MKDFKLLYQESVNQIMVPEFSLTDLNDSEKTNRIIRKRRMASLLSALIFILTVTLFAGGTAYAMTLQRDIFQKERGYKIDDSYPDDAEDGLVYRYSDTGENNDVQFELPEIIADMGTDELIVYDVDSANLYMPFKIIEADVKDVELSKIYIYTPENTGRKSYESLLEYRNDSSEVNIAYRFFINPNWAFETDFGDNYIATTEFVNEYNIKFTIIEGYFEPMDKVLFEASAAFDNMLITINTQNISYDELVTILNSMDLNSYR